MKQTNFNREWLPVFLCAASIGPQALLRLINAYDSFGDIVSAGRRACAQIVGETASKELFSAETEQKCRRIEAWLEAVAQASIVTWCDEDFPRETMHFPNPPSVLFLRGRRELLSRRRTLVMGADAPDTEGRLNAGEFASALSTDNRVVVSLLTNETDACVCRGALQSKAKSLIVFEATGPDRISPPAMRDIFRDCAEEGLLVSGFAPGTKVSADTVAMREALAPAFCQELFVLQAPVPSSALSMAKLFGEAGRDVFALPGTMHSVLYKGNLKLLKEGARLVESVDDIARFGSEVS